MISIARKNDFVKLFRKYFTGKYSGAEEGFGCAPAGAAFLFFGLFLFSAPVGGTEKTAEYFIHFSGRNSVSSETAGNG